MICFLVAVTFFMLSRVWHIHLPVIGRTCETAQGDFGTIFLLMRILKYIGVYSFLGVSM